MTKSNVKPVPDGYHSVTPFLTVEDPAAVLEFMTAALDAVELSRMAGPDGGIRHAEARIGDSIVMLGQARGEWKPSPATLYVYVPDVDATYRKAIAAGGTSLREPATQFYGDRGGGVADTQGNQWWLATHVEDVSPEELKRRMAEAEKAGS